MFRQINGSTRLCLVMRSLTRSAQQHFSVGPNRCNQEDPQTQPESESALVLYEGDQNRRLKLSRRECLRQMYKHFRTNPSERKLFADMQMESKKSIKMHLDPTRLEFVNLKWKERQQEIAMRVQAADKKKYVTRFEMHAGRKEKIK